MFSPFSEIIFLNRYSCPEKFCPAKNRIFHSKNRIFQVVKFIGITLFGICQSYFCLDTNDSNSNQKTILIIDDVPDCVGVLPRILTNAGFKVRIARDGKTGIQTVEKNIT